jgi:hypothetical protein
MAEMRYLTSSGRYFSDENASLLERVDSKSVMDGKSRFRKVCSDEDSQFNFRMQVYLFISAASLILTGISEDFKSALKSLQNFNEFGRNSQNSI